MGQEIELVQDGTEPGAVVQAGSLSVLIPHGIRPLLRSSWNVATASEDWQRPRTMTAAQKSEVRKLLTELRYAHITAPSARLQNRLQAFLGHWFQVDDAAMAGRFVDWARCLSVYSLRAVDDACTEYLRESDKTPKVAKINQLCLKHDQLLRMVRRLEVLEKSVPVVEEPERASDEDRARVRAWFMVAKKQGMTLTPIQQAAFDAGQLPDAGVA